jgi:hypothetical protein
MHPLANIAEKISGDAYFIDDIEPIYDEFGNPNLQESAVPVRVDILRKRKGLPVFRDQNAIESQVTVYECYLLQNKSLVDINKISPRIKLDSGKYLTVIDTTPKLLQVINKIFGQNFLATITDT